MIYSKKDFLELTFIKTLDDFDIYDKIAAIKETLNKKKSSWRTDQKPKEYVSKINNNLDKDKCELLSYLNKLAPNNYKMLFESILKINLNEVLLHYFIESIFSVATKQSMFCSIYVSLIERIQENNDIKNQLNNYILGYKDINKDTKKDNEKTYDNFCKKNKELLGKSGYSQFLGELYLHDMIDKKIIDETIEGLFTNLNANDDEQELVNYVTCIFSFLKTIKSKLENKDEILEKINTSKKNIKIKRLQFKLMDLEDLIT
jgi:hypothetical protein